MSDGLSGMSDESFLGYVDGHSRTDLALFHKNHIFRLCDLAGAERPSLPGDWYNLYWEEAEPYVKKARERIRCKPA